MNPDVPTKPKFYHWRLYGSTYLTLPMVTLITIIDSTFWRVTIISFVLTILVGIRLKYDPKEVIEYFHYEQSLNSEANPTDDQPKDIDKNIKKYSEKLAAKKDNAKWWQFWVWLD